MKITLLAHGTRGDAQPMMVLGNELERRGHQVTLGLPPNLVDFARNAEFRAHSVGVDSQAFLESTKGRDWLATGNTRAFMLEVRSTIRSHADEINTNLIKLCADADLVVSGYLLEDRAAVIVEHYRVPLVLFHSAPLRKTNAVANPLISTRSLPFNLNSLSHSAFDFLVWKGIKTDINKLRKSLALPKTNLATSKRSLLDNSLEIQAYSRLMLPEIKDTDPRRPLIGFVVPDEQMRARMGEESLDVELQNWLSEGEPPIYFGFGSMPVRDPIAAYKTIVRVVDALHLRAVICAGWSSLNDSEAIPKNIYMIRSLNHDLLFSQCKAAIHHGGAGTVAASLSAGLPTMIYSVFADQPFWGAQVERLGVGRHVRFSKLNETNLQEGLSFLLKPTTTQRAKEFGSTLKQDIFGAQRATDLIEKIPT